MINVPANLYGFKHSTRNYGAYVPSAMQELYNKICGTLQYDVNVNFVFPSILPQAALFGWKEDKEIKIWPKDGFEKEAADNLVEFMKDKGMISTTTLKEIKLVYRVVSENTHVAELILNFQDDYEMMNDSQEN